MHEFRMQFNQMVQVWIGLVKFDDFCIPVLLNNVVPQNVDFTNLQIEFLNYFFIIHKTDFAFQRQNSLLHRREG